MKNVEDDRKRLKEKQNPSHPGFLCCHFCERLNPWAFSFFSSLGAQAISLHEGFLSAFFLSFVQPIFDKHRSTLRVVKLST